MRAHYLQHAPFEGLGSIETWLREAGYGITATQLYSGDLLPQLDQLDLLIIMGGPMSVNDESEHPWLAPEKAFIRKVIDAGIPVLGVCLGAQLIANAMGSAVSPNGEPEIGWFPVRRIDHGQADAFCLPEELSVLHWHGETFDLPQGATHLARSDACTNQAFQLGPNVIGLQFHLEATRSLIRDFIESCADDLQPSRYVQPAEVIRAVEQTQLDATTKVMNDILAYLHGTRRHAE